MLKEDSKDDDYNFQVIFNPFFSLSRKKGPIVSVWNVMLWGQHQIGWLNCFTPNCRGLWILIWSKNFERKRGFQQPKAGKIQRWRLWRSSHKSGLESGEAQLDVFLFFVVLIANSIPSEEKMPSSSRSAMDFTRLKPFRFCLLIGQKPWSNSLQNSFRIYWIYFRQNGTHAHQKVKIYLTFFSNCLTSIYGKIRFLIGLNWLPFFNGLWLLRPISFLTYLNVVSVQIVCQM